MNHFDWAVEAEQQSGIFHLNDVTSLRPTDMDGPRHYVRSTADWLWHSLVEGRLVGVPLPYRLEPRVTLRKNSLVRCSEKGHCLVLFSI